MMSSKNNKIVFFLILIFVFSFGFGLVWAAEEHATYEKHAVHEGAVHEEHAAHKTHYSRSQFLDLLWRALNFGLFVAILVYLARKPIANMLRQRQENIKQTIEEADRQKQEARKKYLEYEAKLAQLDKEKEKIISKFIEQGEKERQRIIEEAKKAAEAIKKSAQMAAEQEMKTARAKLREEIAELATNMAGEIIKQKFTKKDQDRLIGEYLAKIGG